MDLALLHEEAGDKPAPGDLLLVQVFINTEELDEEGSNEIDTPEKLGAWLAAHGLIDDSAAVTRDDVRRAHDVREALRSLAFANNDGRQDPGAVDVLNAAAERARLLVRFRDAGPSELAPDCAGVDAALGRLLAIVHSAMQDGTWQRLKACREHSCRWAFYDRSKNRSGAWCTMETCGNRNKARAYRERHAGT